MATKLRGAAMTADDVAWGCLVVGTWVERTRAMLADRLGPAGAPSPEPRPKLLN